MKALLLISIFSLVSCGDILIRDNGNGNEVKVDKEGVDSEGKDSEETTTTTTTTTTTSSKAKAKKKTVSVVAKYTLVGNNPLNHNFVAGDFCSYYDVRNCYLRGVTLQEFSNGKYKVTASLSDTLSKDPVVISKTIIEGDRLVLLMTDAKIASDKSSKDRMLWLKIDVKELSVEILYDLAGQGDSEFGTESLDTLFFE